MYSSLVGGFAVRLNCAGLGCFVGGLAHCLVALLVSEPAVGLLCCWLLSWLLVILVSWLVSWSLGCLLTCLFALLVAGLVVWILGWLVGWFVSCSVVFVSCSVAQSLDCWFLCAGPQVVLLSG